MLRGIILAFRTHTWDIAEYTHRKAQEGTGRGLYSSSIIRTHTPVRVYRQTDCVCYLLFPLTFQLMLQSRPNEKSIPYVWGK